MTAISEELSDEKLTAEDRLLLHVHDPETFAFSYEDCDALIGEISELRSALRSGNGGEVPWLTIDSAPQDGTVILGVTDEAQRPAARVTWFENGKWMATGKPEKFVVQPHGWWPTHWQPMPKFSALDIKP